MAKKPNRITRALIDATVDRGLREIEEDPKRSVRKLTDMGRKFSTGRLMNDVYGMIQDLLRNDDSPYYTAMERLLRNTSRKHLKDFGINFGYNGITCGGEAVRELEKDRDYCIPWNLVLRYNPELRNSLTLKEIANCVQQARELGIYAIMLRLTGPVTDFRELCNLFRKNSDIAFIVFAQDPLLTEPELELMKSSTNVMTMLPADGKNTADNAARLRKEKILYGIYGIYDDFSAPDWINGKKLDELVPYQSVFTILLSGDTCSKKTGAEVSAACRNYRMHPRHPYIVFDMVGDVIQIGRLISSEKSYLEIMENGDIRTKDELISDFRHTTSLEQIFSVALPK